MNRMNIDKLDFAQYNCIKPITDEEILQKEVYHVSLFLFRTYTCRR